MTAPLVPPTGGWAWGGPKGIRIALRLPPEQALDVVVAGLLDGRRFRLKARTSPTTARLVVGRARGLLLFDLNLLVDLLPRRLRVGHWGLLREHVDIDVEPDAAAGHSVVWLHPALGSDSRVACILGDDLEPVATALAASGHLLWVGAWEPIDHQAEDRRQRDQRRAAKARRRAV